MRDNAEGSSEITMLLDFMSDLPNPVETIRRPLTFQVRVMTWSDLTGNSERSSEMAARQGNLVSTSLEVERGKVTGV